jgi:hypothetical protein
MKGQPRKLQRGDVVRLPTPEDDASTPPEFRAKRTVTIQEPDPVEANRRLAVAQLWAAAWIKRAEQLKPDAELGNRVRAGGVKGAKATKENQHDKTRRIIMAEQAAQALHKKNPHISITQARNTTARTDLVSRKSMERYAKANRKK